MSTKINMFKITFFDNLQIDLFIYQVNPTITSRYKKVN